MPEAKRNQIKRKVSAAESRNKTRAKPTTVDRVGEKAIEAKDKFATFARKHPVITVAGGLAVGVLVSSLFRGSPTRKAGRAFGKKTASLAAIAAELAVAYAQQAYQAADEARRAGADKLGELGGTVGDGARSLTGDAADYASGAAAAVGKAGKSALKSIRSRMH